MKRIAIVWGLNLLLLCGSFGVLLVEDRRLAVPLPYSVPIAFAATLLIAAALFAVAQAIVSRRPMQIVERRRPDAAGGDDGVPRRPAEGVVLLDFSRLVTLDGQGA